MTRTAAGRVVIGHAAIAARVAELARAIARAPAPPEIAIPVLTGGFVFAADLLRALAREGLDLPVEWVWLRSYGSGKRPGPITVLKGPGEAVRGAHALLIDDVLDTGYSLLRAKELLRAAGAARVTAAVAVKKAARNAVCAADHIGFAAGEAFLVGYGMDEGGGGRGLPDIWSREDER